MSQAESDPTGFAAFATFLGTPLPDDPIRALRILRKEAAAEIERLLAFLDALGGDPDLEDGADAEPGEDSEPSSGWTEMEARFNHHVECLDEGEEDDPAEDSDAGEDNGDLEPSLAGGGFTHPNGQDVDLESDGDDLEPGEDASDAPGDPAYAACLRVRRGPPAMPHGFHNVTCMSEDGETFYLKPPWAK